MKLFIFIIESILSTQEAYVNAISAAFNYLSLSHLSSLSKGDTVSTVYISQN